MSFATLQEAWGVATFGELVEASPTEPPKQARQAGQSALATPQPEEAVADDNAGERSEASQRSFLFCTNYLREVYQKHGSAGLAGLMDEDMMRQLRLECLLSFDWVDTNALLFIFMCICALWLLADVLGRR